MNETPIRELTALDLNLDAMSPEELEAFIESFRDVGLRTRARELFPNQRREDARETEARNLLDYANYKLEAIRARLAGHIQKAQELEPLCDKIYHSLPAWARGW